MKDKHTPGPWIVRDDQIQDIHGNTIADIPKRGYWNTTAGMIYEDMPWEANARLMAAAPELFEFVESLATFEIPSGYSPYKALYVLRGAISDARALLAKIEGDE